MGPNRSKFFGKKLLDPHYLYMIYLQKISDWTVVLDSFMRIYVFDITQISIHFWSTIFPLYFVIKHMIRREKSANVKRSHLEYHTYIAKYIFSVNFNNLKKNYLLAVGCRNPFGNILLC
jgi:hypothetical protein